MRHPLLLQRSLPRLPQPPLAAPPDFETSHLDLLEGVPGGSVPDQAPAEAEEQVGPHAHSFQALAHLHALFIFLDSIAQLLHPTLCMYLPIEACLQGCQ